MKRHLSDSDTEDFLDDDVHTDEGTEHTGNSSARKKRRGVIEKRRRDRINSSLSELRRLVPAAFEKQGTAKLEKAEILQLTVDHLRTLHSKGVNPYTMEPAELAMDYRSVGYRECVAEVARYLVTHEGKDIQDPLRLRLLGHLQCHAAQKENNKCMLNTGNYWSSMTRHPWAPHQYPTDTVGAALPSSALPASAAAAAAAVASLAGHYPGSRTPPQSEQPSPRLPLASHTSSLSSLSSNLTPHLSQYAADQSRISPQLDSFNKLACSISCTSTSSLTAQCVQSGGHMTSALHRLPQWHHPQFPVAVSLAGPPAAPLLSTAPAQGYPAAVNASSTFSQTLSSLKAYRPWGAEMAC